MRVPKGMTPRQFVWEPITLWDGGSGDWRLQVVSSDVDDTVDAALATRRHEANGCFWQDVARYLVREARSGARRRPWI